MIIEKIDNLNIIIDSCYNITNDAILIADFIKNDNIKADNMLEIGFGSGYISLKLKDYFKNIYAIDIQKKSYDNLIKNIENNSIKNITALNMDIKEYNNKKFDVIISNPPYFKINSGKLPNNEINLISKFEKELTLSDLILSVKRLLNENGLFYIIYPLNRLNELENEINNNNLKILKIKKYNKRFIIKGKA